MYSNPQVKNFEKWRSATFCKEAEWLFLFFVMLVFFAGCTATKESVRKVNGVEVYECLNGTGENAKDLMSEIGVGQIVLLSENLLYDIKLKAIRENVIESSLNEKAPDPKYKGIIVLDWEGEKMTDILAGVVEKSDRFISASELFIQAYKYVKLLRPKATVGFYGFPARNYWNRNEEWRIQNQKIGLFLSHFDAIFPSLYDFYETTNANRAQELSYVRENVEAALEIGSTYSRPVYPFVWHRYHDSNKKLGLGLVPVDEFREHISQVSNTEFNGEKVKGIIWWSAEQYFYNIRKTQDAKSVSDFTTEVDGILPVYLNALLDGLKKSEESE